MREQDYSSDTISVFFGLFSGHKTDSSSKWRFLSFLVRTGDSQSANDANVL